jgi:oligopeptide transport system ATP-binding protein
MGLLLDIQNLQLAFSTDEGVVPAVRGINLSLEKGQSLAVVGESGAGKSQVFYALMGLLTKNATVSGAAYFQGQDLLQLPQAELNTIRGRKIAMIFQDPMTALNPFLRVGVQLTEVLNVHLGITGKQAKQLAVQMLERVKLHQPDKVFRQFPHELSGGMRQRVMIAMALLCKPDLIIADEPTTALDVTVQTDILRLFAELQDAFASSLILITHDLPLVSSLCQHIAVMYAGQVVEYGTVDDIFKQTQHPYTQGLLASMPQQQTAQQQLYSMPGSPPNPLELPAGCAFVPRCERASEQCSSHPQWVQTSSTQGALCWHVDA